MSLKWRCVLTYVVECFLECASCGIFRFRGWFPCLCLLPITCGEAIILGEVIAVFRLVVCCWHPKGYQTLGLFYHNLAPPRDITWPQQYLWSIRYLVRWLSNGSKIGRFFFFQSWSWCTCAPHSCQPPLSLSWAADRMHHSDFFFVSCFFVVKKTKVWVAISIFTWNRFKCSAHFSLTGQVRFNCFAAPGKCSLAGCGNCRQSQAYWLQHRSVFPSLRFKPVPPLMAGVPDECESQNGKAVGRTC